jgi:hypothetical protein
MVLVGVVAVGIVHSGAGSLANFVITEKPIFEKSVATKGVDIGYLSIYILRLFHPAAEYVRLE